MKSDIKQMDTFCSETPARRARSRLNAREETAGVPDPPARGRWTRTVALLDAALKVWEANQPKSPSVWRHKPR
jgi:hypothetical protein